MVSGHKRGEGRSPLSVLILLSLSVLSLGLGRETGVTVPWRGRVFDDGCPGHGQEFQVGGRSRGTKDPEWSVSEDPFHKLQV